MPDKLQIPHPIRTLSDAVRIHLADFTNKHEDDFNYRWDRESSEIEYFRFRFARVIVSTHLNWKQEDLGFLRLRRLNRSLTEMVIEDSPGLIVGTDLFLDTEYVRFDDYDDDKRISQKKRNQRAVALFNLFNSTHKEVRQYVIQALQQDQFLEAEETKRPDSKPSVAAYSDIRVFINYAHEDVESAMKIYEQLQAIEGVDPWFDKENLLPGIKWRPAIKKAIRESDFFLALLSKRSVSKRGYVQTEMKEAFEIWDQFPENKAFLIPIRLEDCEPSHEKLREVQHQDFFPNWDRGFRKVLNVIRTHERSDAGPYSKPTVGYEYRCAIVDFDNGLTNLGQICQRLNSIQNFFHFSFPSFPFEHGALREFEGTVNLYVPDLPSFICKQKVLLNADLVVSLTKYLLAFEEDGETCNDYLSLPSDVDDTFKFVTTHGLYEAAKKAGCTFEKSMVYHLLTQLIIHFGSDLGFHTEVRGCILDFCEEHAWMIKGMKRMRLCRSCTKAVENADLKKAVLAILADPIRV